MSIETSADIGELAKALATFQGKVGSVGKGSTAKVEKDGRLLYSYKYADLASVLEATREERAAAGLSVAQFPTGDAVSGITLVTTLLHSSGQWMRGNLMLKPTDTKPQTIGSLITYMRRYSYSAALGIATEEDDDGAAAQGGKPAAAGGAAKANTVPAAGKPATASQVQQVHILKEKIGGWTGKADHDKHPYRAALLAYKDKFGKPVTTSKDLTSDQANNLLMRMQGMIDRQTKNAANGAGAVSEAMNGNGREPGSDDGDDGEAPDPGLLEDVRAAALDLWGKNVEDQGPPWLLQHFGVKTTGALSKLQAKKALQLLLAAQ